MSYPFPATSIAANALPPADEVDFTEVQAVLVGSGSAGGAIQYRDRRPGGLADLELVATWLHVERAWIDAFRLHHRTYRVGPPWPILLPCDSDPTLVSYLGPLQIQRTSNTYSRVRALLGRALPSAT